VRKVVPASNDVEQNARPLLKAMDLIHNAIRGDGIQHALQLRVAAVGCRHDGGAAAGSRPANQPANTNQAASRPTNRQASQPTDGPTD